MKLQLRVGDVEFWKGELDNKLAQLKEEIEEAVSMKYVGVLMKPTRIFFLLLRLRERVPNRSQKLVKLTMGTPYCLFFYRVLRSKLLLFD